MEWAGYLALAFVSYSAQGLLFKYAAHHGCDKYLTTFYVMLVVFCLSAVISLILGVGAVTSTGVLAAAISGSTYALYNIFRVGALLEMPASIVYPLLRLYNAPLLFLLVAFTGETMTAYNAAGVLLALASVYLLSNGEEK